MEERPGTLVKQRTERRHKRVDCRHWLEFEISEILMDKIRYTYRVAAKVDESRPTMVESGQTRKDY